MKNRLIIVLIQVIHFLDVLFYVFAAKPCHWASWTEGSCDRTCGGGKKLDTRRKLVQEQNNGECLDGDTRVESCNPQQCPGEFFLLIIAFGQCFNKNLPKMFLI